MAECHIVSGREKMLLRYWSSMLYIVLDAECHPSIYFGGLVATITRALSNIHRINTIPKTKLQIINFCDLQMCLF